RQARLLSAAAPRDVGGMGCDMRELTAMCATLAQGCASSGMILAMHHIQIACLARHGLGSPFFRRYLEAQAAQQTLIASVTSEVGTWGETRASICAIEPDGNRLRLHKDATTVSYGAMADDLLVTCRRGPQAPASDQVLVLLKKGDYTLAPTSAWN